MPLGADVQDSPATGHPKADVLSPTIGPARTILAGFDIASTLFVRIKRQHFHSFCGEQKQASAKMQCPRYTQFLNLLPDDQPPRDAIVGRPAVLVTGFSSRRSTGRVVVVRRPRMPAPPQRVSPPEDAADLVYREVCPRESADMATMEPGLLVAW